MQRCSACIGIWLLDVFLLCFRYSLGKMGSMWCPSSAPFVVMTATSFVLLLSGSPVPHLPRLFLPFSWKRTLVLDGRGALRCASVSSRLLPFFSFTLYRGCSSLSKSNKGNVTCLGNQTRPNSSPWQRTAATWQTMICERGEVSPLQATANLIFLCFLQRLWPFNLQLNSKERIPV